MDEVSRARSFQRHELLELEVTPRNENRRIEAGTILIRTAQALGSLAVHLLEPQSADGLARYARLEALCTKGLLAYDGGDGFDDNLELGFVLTEAGHAVFEA